MKFCIICSGSYGDMRPYVALAIGLKKRGHDVVLASYKPAKSLCEQYGIAYFQLEGDIYDLVSIDKVEKFLFEKQGSKIALFREYLKALKTVLSIQLESSAKVVKGCDVLIYNTVSYAGPHLAEYLDVPSFCITLVPDLQTKQHPPTSYFSHPLTKLGKVGNYLAHFLQTQKNWHAVRADINQWRKNVLNLRKMSFWGPRYDHFIRDIPVILPFNPYLINRPKDWPCNVHITNFLRIIDQETWTLPPGLKDFLAGNDSLYITLGTLNSVCPKKIVENVIDVLTKQNIKAIISASWPGIKDLKLPPWIFALDYVPHGWLLPQVKAIIHHGGIGTTASGLYAGLPSMVIPFVGDEFYWGTKLFEWQVGPRMLTVQEFSEKAFEERVKSLLSNSSYKAKAMQIKQKLEETPDGVEMTLDVIFNYLQNPEYMKRFKA